MILIVRSGEAERRYDNGSSLVIGTDVGYEVFHLEARLREIDFDPITMAI